jgi:prepilin peptidase CpaA
VTDLKHRKIFNWLTLPAIVVGLLFSLVAAGAPGLGQSLLGVIIALAAFGWMWMIQVMGAGDVKLLMAYGALAGVIGASGRSGLEFVADTILLTLFVGGAIALVQLAAKGRLLGFFGKIRRFLLSATSKYLVTEFPKADPKLKMPFGIAIAIAACWAWFDNPLVRWGIGPWR